MTPLIPGRHHNVIDQAALAAAAGNAPLTILLLPVQHGKTTYGSQYHAAWTLGNWPEKKILACSYNRGVAEDKLGRPTRNIIERCGPEVFGVQVDWRRSSSMMRWDLVGQDSSFYCTSVNTGIAARRVDLGLIDDPIGSRGDVDTKRKRDELWNWYREEFTPRLAPGAAIFAIMSPWHPDDIIHRMIRHAIENDEPIRVIDLPAIAPGPEDEGPVSEARRSVAVAAGMPEPPKEPYVDELGREPGEALWPEVRDVAFIQKLTRDMGERQAAAQLGMRPRTAAGSLFKPSDFRYYRRAANGKAFELLTKDGSVRDTVPLTAVQVFQMADLATGEGEDFFVLGTFGVTPQHYTIVLHIDRPMPVPQAPEQLDLLKASWLRWRPFRVGIEAVSYQMALVQFAKRAGLPAVPITRGRGGSKDARIELASVRVQQETVFFPAAAIWRETFENELTSFRVGGGGANDDQCDVLADATEAVAQRGAQSRPEAAHATPRR